MAWIKDRIDALVGLEAEAIVIVLGAIIVTIPLAIMALYVVQRALQRRA
jgi:predicted aconitase with swiveling domain